MLACIGTEWKLLTWLRYSLWIPLYPLGVLAEGSVCLPWEWWFKGHGSGCELLLTVRRSVSSGGCDPVAAHLWWDSSVQPPPPCCAGTLFELLLHSAALPGFHVPGWDIHRHIFFRLTKTSNLKSKEVQFSAIRNIFLSVLSVRIWVDMFAQKMLCALTSCGA